MRALVIGATGFIGLAVVDELLARGAVVRVTRRKQTPTILLRRRPVERVEASLQEPEKLRRAMDGCDTVFLTGAYYPRYSTDIEGSLTEGVGGVRNACQAALAAGVKKLVYTSSIATLAPAPVGRVADEDDVARRIPLDSVYRAVKWAMERTVEQAGRAGLPAVTLMPGGCIGPGDVRLGTGSVLVDAVRGELPWWVDGVVNLVDVRDVAAAHVAAAGAVPSSRYCLAAHNVSVGWFLRHIATRYGGRVPEQKLSAKDARIRSLADEQEAAPRRQRVGVPREFVDIVTAGQAVSSARARSDLGFDPVALDDSLDAAFDWFVRHTYITSCAKKGCDDEHGPGANPGRDARAAR